MSDAVPQVTDPPSITPASDPAAVAAPPEAPQTAAPTPEPVVTPAPAVEVAPAAPETAAAPEAPKVVAHTETPSLMEQAGAKKPEESAVPVAVAAEPAAPTYEPFNLPEGISLEADKLGNYTTVLGRHNIPQAAGQELLDMYIAERQRDAVDTLARQHQAFADMRKEWRDQTTSDPEMGGANLNTTMDAVAFVRDRYVPKTGPIRDAFDKMLTTTGVGDHPEFFRFIARIGRDLREPAPPRVAQFSPPPDIGRRPGRNNGVAIYDNPTSPQPRAGG